MTSPLLNSDLSAVTVIASFLYSDVRGESSARGVGMVLRNSQHRPATVYNVLYCRAPLG